MQREKKWKDMRKERRKDRKV